VGGWISYPLNKQPLFSGGVRSFGIGHAKGQYIVYLDTDDFFGKDHLEIIADGLRGRDWVWLNDIVFRRFRTAVPDRFTHTFVRECDINRRFHHGTSNICHKPRINNRLMVLGKPGYLHDYYFISERKKASTNSLFIGSAQYYVCHVPRVYDI